MKVLITGASGFLGKKVFSTFKDKYETYGSFFSYKRGGINNSHYFALDVTSTKSTIRQFEKLEPDFVIHTVGIPDPDFCETHKEKAWEINVNGTKSVTLACKETSSRLAYISTNYIFDGKKKSAYLEDEKPNPLNFYGMTKLEGEKIAQEIQDALIIRLPLLYGYSDNNDRNTFITETLRKLKNREEIFVDAKTIRYPTLIDDVSKILLKMGEKRARGVYHVSGEEGLTKYEFTKLLGKGFHLQTDKVFQKTGSSFAKRPQEVHLSITKLKEEFQCEFTPLRKGIELMIKIVDLKNL